MALSRALPALAVMAALALAAPAARAQGVADLPAVKAAFVYNFIKLVTWPDNRFSSPAAPLQVCVLSEDPMEPALARSLGGKLVGSHVLEVTTLGPDGDVLQCHVLYLGSHALGRHESLMARAGGKGVLLVDEGPNFSWPDGMIRLFIEQNRVRFELNLESLERSGLRVDPRLIRLARIATR
jgi:hypothetical protein